MRMIGGKLGRVVETSVPVRFPHNTATQTLWLTVAGSQGYPVQMLHRGVLFRRGQIVTATHKAREDVEKRKRKL